MNGGVDCFLITTKIIPENKQLKIILLGCAKFGDELTNELIIQGFKFNSIFSISREFEVSYSDKLEKKYNF